MLKPSLNRIHIYYSYDVTAQSIFMNLPKQRKREARALNCIVVKTLKRVFLFVGVLELEFVAVFMSNWALPQCEGACSRREDEPTVMCDHFQAPAPRRNTSDSICRQWCSAAFCLVNIIKFPLSLFLSPPEKYVLCANGHLTNRRTWMQ